MKKTILIYGSFGAIVAFEILVVKMIGHLKSEDILLYLIPVNAIFLGVAICLDSFGLFCLVLACISFKGLCRVEIGIITFNPYIIGINGLIIFTIYKTFLKKYRYGFTSTDFIIILICFTFLTSTIISETLIDSGFLAFHSIFIPVVSYYVIKGIITTSDEYKAAIFFFIGGITVFGCFAIIEFAVTLQRVYLFSLPPVSIATMYVPTLIYLFYARWWRRFIGFICFIILSLAFLSAMSRVYILSMLISPALYVAIRRGKALILMFLMLISTLILTLLLASSPYIFKNIKISKQTNKTLMRVADMDYWKNTIYGRSLSYLDGLSDFERSPFFGVGIHKGENYSTNHNFHIEWLEFGGIFGYILYSSLFLIHFKIAMTKAKSDVFVAINLMIIFIILCNSLGNGFMHGTMPYIGFIFMGFNEARIKLLSSSVEPETDASAQTNLAVS
ncbi:hypothetical protein [Desulfonema magnum]|uniref:O-antigen ligase family protein n=1 Tax=Desulfonema magnum TaxID=45655 RepID=A0A975BS22_9BACT|nr:hypothetical protein [Desulfonema magnum]QTA90025.1 Uncharacterized protein dnm_060850 [Desulfonema magnum]